MGNIDNIQFHTFSCSLIRRISSFVNEWCDVGLARSVPVDVIWKAHCDWSNMNGRGDGFSKQKFTNKLKSIVPDIKRDRKRADLSLLRSEYGWDSIIGDNRIYCYHGVDLKREYKIRRDSRDSWDRVGTY